MVLLHTGKRLFAVQEQRSKVLAFRTIMPQQTPCKVRSVLLPELRSTRLSQFFPLRNVVWVRATQLRGSGPLHFQAAAAFTVQRGHARITAAFSSTHHDYRSYYPTLTSCRTRLSVLARLSPIYSDLDRSHTPPYEAVNCYLNPQGSPLVSRSLNLLL